VRYLADRGKIAQGKVMRRIANKVAEDHQQDKSIEEIKRRD
jgi:hypothetical protein